MRLGRSRLIATLLVIGVLFTAIFNIRRRRAKMRASLEDFMARKRAQEHDEDDEPFIELESLDEARSMDHTAVIMQGGGGAQIYLTVPVKYVACEETTLVTLLKLIDSLEWNEPQRAGMSFELAPIGSGVYGGMGGGSVVDGVWLHTRLLDLGVMEPVSAVIHGLRPVEGIAREFTAKLSKPG